MFKDIHPTLARAETDLMRGFHGEIYAPDIILQFDTRSIRVIDTFNHREEIKTFNDEAEMCAVISAFMQPNEPSEAFCKAFPFWA